jgi:hypothetical protein
MNDHGTLTVELAETNETRYIVDYESDRVREALGALPTGTTIPIRMSRVGSRSNVWRAAGLPGAPSAAESPVEP